MRDNRIFRATRLLAVFIVPFLLAAFYILFLRTSETKTLFAWDIQAPMTAMMLGAAYVGGAYFFIRAATAHAWQRIGAGFLPVTAFATMMAIATLLHWDKFEHTNLSFYTWVVVYMTTPFLVFISWLRNRRTDPNTPESADFVLPHTGRIAFGVIGGGALLIGIGLFLLPQVLIGIWAWALTPLTARVVGAMFALPGILGIYLAFDPRWSAAKILLESQVISMVFILISVLRTWATFDVTRPMTWVFVGFIVGFIIGIPVLYVLIEWRRKLAVRQHALTHADA
ncbi:MAG TPA: hypothetical protein VGK87_03240 [Anaerolineae bacterium]|jgi:hypothetical protein